MAKKPLFPQGEILKKGMEGPAVKFLQQWMQSRFSGINGGGHRAVFEALVCDGKYGDMSHAAVAALQTMMDSKINGEFDQATQAKAGKHYGIDFSAIVDSEE